MMNKWHNPLYKAVYWLSFNDFLNVCTGTTIEAPQSFDREDIFQFLIELNIDFNLYSDIVNSTDEKCEEELALIFNKLVNRYFSHYCYSVDNEEALCQSTTGIKHARAYFMKILNVYTYTREKYKKLIALYTSQANDLMKQLITTSEGGTRFNDTPQVEEVNIDFESNNFTTTLTKMKNVVSADSDTPIKKLEEIARNYRNLMLEWVNEFDSLFVEEINL